MKNILTIAAVALVVALGVVFTFRQPASEPQPQPGAVSVLQSPVTIDGVTHWYSKIAMRTATSTVCSIRTPAATTTLSFRAVWSTGASYATQYMVGYGSDTNSTTTSIVAAWTVGAGAKSVLAATTTATAPVDALVPPNRFINVNLSTSSASATFAPIGECNVTLTEV